jgi:hypothetical protein
MKKLLPIAMLCLACTTAAVSQDTGKRKLERPERCDVAEVDQFVNKSFDSYEESLKITEAVNFIRVEGEGDAKTIKNANGETLTKDAALLQLGELLIRAKKQGDNIKSVQDLQPPATESLKKCAMTKKPKATKNLNKGGEALNEVVKETKKQVELIERQIADIKAMKG